MLSDRLLIVDDDVPRRELISKKICEIIPGMDLSKIDFCADLTSAKLKVRRTWYPVVILDMMLPNERFCKKKLNLRAGVDFLEFLKIQEKNRPQKVIGISGLKENVDINRSDFSRLGFRMYYASVSDFSWIYEECESLNYFFLESSVAPLRKTLIISVHGINTFGGWQERLEQELLELKRNDLTYRFFKYPMFPFLFFYVPHLRRKIVDRFVRDMQVAWQGSDFVDHDIIFVGHSFGTYILYNGLMRLKIADLQNRTKRIIFSGSMLSRNLDVSSLACKYKTILVNDCGVNDKAVLFAELFVPRAGMSGRLGFSGMANNVVNRYFLGGHSLYFERSGFIKEFWLPLIDDLSLKCASQFAINEGNQSIFERCLQAVVECISSICRLFEKALRMLFRPFKFF